MKPIHAFPARMAPEIVEQIVKTLPENSLILDPMCGSGTTLRYALEAGHRVRGCDIDPLAVKMSRVWCHRYNFEGLRKDISRLKEHLGNPKKIVSFDDSCPETNKFLDYWFSPKQQKDLRLISNTISLLFPEGRLRDFFHVAMSRIIITKFHGASLAWDISHSRPHKKKKRNDFETIPEFFSSAEKVIRLLESQPLKHGGKIFRGDCRSLRSKEKFDAVITSPPYLNAIDYMRGHKFSLVWMGHRIPALREIRSESIGAEHRLNDIKNFNRVEEVIENICSGEQA